VTTEKSFTSQVPGILSSALDGGILNGKLTKSYEDALKDGNILCNLNNVLKPGLVEPK
jgi:hypothetical protein